MALERVQAASRFRHRCRWSSSYAASRALCSTFLTWLTNFARSVRAQSFQSSMECWLAGSSRSVCSRSHETSCRIASAQPSWASNASASNLGG
eukprot:3876018-Pyramimonas_sp.AAC.1